MDMYIGNATKSFVDFAYRVPEQKGTTIIRVPIGGQIKLPHDMSAPDIEAIETQWRKYGLVKVDEIDLARGAFTGLCYAVGKPVSAEKLRRAMEKNEDTLEELGQRMRQEAAVAVNSQIEENLGGDASGLLKGLSMSVTELAPPGGFRDDDGAKHINEGVRVSREPNTEGRASTPAKGSRKR